jgi:predicted signal transduction protein with EAL and GGDEF domain
MATDNAYGPPAVATIQPEGRGSLVPVAISLIVVSVLWSFLALMGIVYFYSHISAPDADADTRHVLTTYMLYTLVSIAYCLMLVSGAFSMIRKGSYVWAVATSCLAMVPMLGPCYVLGIPIGIWALIVLRRPDVRKSFRKA